MTTRHLKISTMLGLRHTPNAYGVTVTALMVSTGLAIALEPPLEYIAALGVLAWAVLYWTLRRETTPRYRRDNN